MTMEIAYQPEHVGDWGVPTPVTGGRYGTETLALDDGTPLFFRFWQAARREAPVLIVFHGLGAHTGWFIDLGNALHARGVSVYMPDHRGFGRSGGARGHVRHGATYIRDANRFLTEVRKREPGLPVAILGHSMGGIFAVHLAAEEARAKRDRLAGMILVNPWVADTTRIAPGRALQIFGRGLVGSSHVYHVAGGPEVMTMNAEAARLLEADQYWVRGQSAAFLYQVTLLRAAMLRHARSVRTPALVIQCERDLAVAPAATRRCYEVLGSADKRWKTYPDFAHDFEFERERSALDDDLAEWMLQRRSS